MHEIFERGLKKRKMTLELILGPMGSGKTDELLRRVSREAVVKKKIMAFKPLMDDRYSKEYIVAHKLTLLDEPKLL